MERHPPLRSAEELLPGDHVCSVYHSDVRRYKVLAAFIRGGIARNEQVLCFTDEQSASDLLAKLRARNVDVDRYVATSQVVVATAQQSYLVGGSFQPDTVVDQWKDTVQQALAHGFSGLRVSGDLAWANRNVPGGEHFVAYERRIQREIFEQYPVTGLCEFDMRRFDPSWLERIWDLHSVIATA